MLQLVGDYLLVQVVHVRNRAQDMMLVKIMFGMETMLLHVVHLIRKGHVEVQR